LNVAPVVDALRQQALPTIAAGAAHLRWPAESSPPEWLTASTAGVLVFLRQTLRSDQRAGWSDLGNQLHCYLVQPDGSDVALTAVEKPVLLRALFTSVVRTKTESAAPALNALLAAETRLLQELRRPRDHEVSDGIRYAVTPLFAATLDR
jgi:hypothetical protein